MAITIQQNIPLKDFTTFRIGGPARFFCSVTNEEELVEATTFAQQNNLEIFVLGGGSNILVSDSGFEGLVIKMEMRGMSFAVQDGCTMATVQAGENWDEFVKICVEKELYGIENLSFIPGTVGAAPVQNIGAYGSEVREVVDRVRVFDVTQGVYTDFLNEQCEFEYRNSLFKREPGRYIITTVVLRLYQNGVLNLEYKDLAEYLTTQENKNPTLLDVRNAVIEIRKRKLPDVKEIGTAGSFFKNPIVARGHADQLKEKYPGMPTFPVDGDHVKIPLGWVIDKICNFKGVGRGDVGTYKNQALVLVNKGSATASDIQVFAHEIERVVFEKTHIKIEPEVLYI